MKSIAIQNFVNMELTPNVLVAQPDIYNVDFHSRKNGRNQCSFKMNYGELLTKGSDTSIKIVTEK